MAWSGGTFSRANGDTGWASDAGLGIGIEAVRHDNQDNDFKNGINECLNKAGQNAMTGNLNLGGNLPTNIGAGTAAAPALCMNNDTNTGLFSAAADQIGIATNGAERVRIDASGKVGIGTTAPGYNVDIQGTATAIYNTRFSADNTGAQFSFQKSRGASIGTNTIVQNGDLLGQLNWWGATGTSYAIAAQIRGEIDGIPDASNDMPGRLTFHTTPDGTASHVERMRITNAGNIGIGTTTPSGNLQISGSNSRLKVSNTAGTAATTAIGADSGVGWFGTETNHPVYFSTNNTERVRIDSSGKVFVNTTTSVVGGQQAVYSTNAATAAVVAHVAANTAVAALICSKQENLATTAQDYVYFVYNNGAGGNGKINGNGANQAAFGTYSDERLKDNIADLPSQIANIFALRPVEFDYKDGSGHQVGFIAQEVEAVYPDLIGEDKDGFLTLTGLGKNEARMIKAFQEFAQLTEAKIAALEARIAALEA